MSDHHRHSYRALVAALREEFSPLQIEALKIELEDARYRLDAIGVLRQAVGDAWDVEYDAMVARTEYAWAPDDDNGALLPSAEDRARRLADAYGGDVYLREVTDWRSEVES